MTENKSVMRAVRILEYLARSESPKSLGVISRGLEMSKSTVYRFLSTLAARGYVRQDPDTSRYALGSRAIWLGMRYLEGIDVRRHARPFLEELAQTTGETVHLGILDNDQVVYIDKIPSKQPVEMRSRVGGRVLVYSTALGKVLLAAQPESVWERYVAEADLAPRARNTIVDPAKFVEHIKEVRAHGYATDYCENEDDIRCVAAPIHDHTGAVVAAVSASGSTISMTREKVRSVIPQVQQTARAISNSLGFHAESSRESGVPSEGAQGELREED